MEILNPVTCVNLSGDTESKATFLLSWMAHHYIIKMFSIQTAAVNRENLAEFYLLLQNVKFHASTYFNRYFEDALKEMYKFFQQNPDVEICIAHTMSLYPHETLLESLKLFNTSPRTLTNEIVEDNLFFLSQGAVLTNLQTSCLNGYLAFLRAD